jgi:SP family general alpha glucoside:H+ symporter-like MFS transporter
MSGFAEPKNDAPLGAADYGKEKNLHTVELFESNEGNIHKEHMTNAEEAENREHDMTLWEAVKDHPAACFWAFVFCFTIVSC